MDIPHTDSQKQERCRHAFIQLSAALSVEKAKGHAKEAATQAKCLDAADRFNIWASSGEFQNEARLLCDAPRLADQIFKLLDDLGEALTGACRITAEQQEVGIDTKDEHDIFSDSENDSDMDHDEYDIQPESELEERLLFVSDLITHLFRLTVLIRNIPLHDVYVRAAATVADDVLGDNDVFNDPHVRHMLPKLKKAENKWLKDRMYKAISLRRRHLRSCRERYHLRESNGARTAALKVYLLGARDSPKPELQAIETPETPGNRIARDILAARSLRQDILQLSAVNRSGGLEFDCPYCFERRRDVDEIDWRQHALEDIRPYACTFEDCGLKLFASQAAWFGHEMQTHRCEWRCNLCSSKPERDYYLTYQSPDELESHARARHGEQIPEAILPAFIQACHRLPIINFRDENCPFCDSWGYQWEPYMATMTQMFQDHVGDHMLELACATLPKIPQLSPSERGNVSDMEAQSGYDATRVGYNLLNVTERGGGKPKHPPQKKSDINSRDEDGRTPLALASLHGDVDLVTAFLELPAIEPQVPDNNGRTPLSLAAESGHYRIVKILAQRIAVHHPDHLGRNALSWACEGSSVDTIITLVQESVTLTSPLAYKHLANREDDRGRTAISYAAENPRLEILETLLCYDPDPFRRDALGQLPIDLASRVGNYRNTLLLFGACWAIHQSSRDIEAMTPAQWAREHHCEEALENIVGIQFAEPDSWDKIRRAWESFQRRRTTGDIPRLQE